MGVFSSDFALEYDYESIWYNCSSYFYIIYIFFCFKKLIHEIDTCTLQ